MPITENLTTECHQQDTDYYCGAACAQMVLQSIGAGHMSQVGLYNDNHSHSVTDVGVNWATAPDGLNWTMNNRKPASFANHFVLFDLTNEDLISRKIIWTIHHYQVAPIAMVYGWQHWIVVKGYMASAAPANFLDNSYTIDGFFINNPWPPTIGPTPPPHTTGDSCGTGGDFGIANEYITYAFWKSTYMTGIPGGHWTGKFVAVCDPEPANKEIGKQKETRNLYDGEKLLDRKIAMELALKFIEENGFRSEKIIGNALFGEIKATNPTLVQRLDRKNDYYYIVPLQNEKKKIVSLVNLNARHGNFNQSAFSSDNKMEIKFKPFTKEALIKIITKFVKIGRYKGQPIFNELFAINPSLVWRPCLESLSPNLPFYLLTYGNYQIYVRIDGKVFSKLTISGKGI